MTKMLHESRIEAQERLTENAEELGANAIITMRFDANDLGELGQEMGGYSTAVRVQKATRA